MKPINWNTKPRLPKSDAKEQNPFVGHFPSRVSRYLTLWWWEQGPVTGKGNTRLFWERLNTDAPKTAKPYCYLLNKIKFSSNKHGGGKVYGECEHYNFNGISPHLLGDPREGSWWEAGVAWIVWRHGYWWAAIEARHNSRMAQLINKAWKNR